MKQNKPGGQLAGLESFIAALERREVEIAMLKCWRRAAIVVALGGWLIIAAVWLL